MMIDVKRGTKPGGSSGVVSTAQHEAVVIPSAHVRGAEYLFLNGTLRGTVHQSPGNPDAGSLLSFQGHGKISPLGGVHFSGILHGADLNQADHAGGSLKLTSKNGSVTLQLDGPSRPGHQGPTSGTYAFLIIKGTGDHTKDLGNGSVIVTLERGSISFTFPNTPNQF
jgi:hypothetical protein